MAKKNKLTPNRVSILNKKAKYLYFIIDRFTAGVALSGTEVKSLREGKAGLVDSFCIVQDGEVWLKNMYIAEYKYSSFNSHGLRRDRKLLLTKKEIRNLAKEVGTPGMSIIPLKVFFTDKGLAKVEIALCKGKKDYDKRATIKENEGRRELDRVRKNYKY